MNLFIFYGKFRAQSHEGVVNGLPNLKYLYDSCQWHSNLKYVAKFIKPNNVVKFLLKYDSFFMVKFMCLLI